MLTDSDGHFPFLLITAAIGAVIGAVVGGITAAKSGGSIWKGALKGAAIGGLVGLGAGAVGSVLVTGSATASTAAVLGTASVKLAATGTTAGMTGSKALDHLSKGYEKARSVITGTTNVYRSISSAEATDIMNTSQFNFTLGGMEAKQFAFSYGEALKFGSQPIINQTSIVSASVPNSMVNQFYLHNVDYGIFTRIMTVDYETIGLFNQAVEGTIKIMP